MTVKKRLDVLIVERGIADSRAKAQAIIAAGQLQVNGQILDKCGQQVPVNAEICLLSNPCPYVSRGGLKLAHAISCFQIDVRGMVCMDVGASTGGFTDCLLQHGAQRVYAVDVGYGQLDWTLRNDSRVIVLEKQNIRHMKHTLISESIDLLAIDVSFISLKTALPPALSFLKPTGAVIALIKPQFEAGREQVGKGGVIRDTNIREKVVQDLRTFFSEDLKLKIVGLVKSPVHGAKGNEEYLIYMKTDGGCRKHGGTKVELEGYRQT